MLATTLSDERGAVARSREAAALATGGLLARFASGTVYALGLRYVLTPVLLNASMSVSVAVAFNSVLGSRRYPACFARKQP